MGDLLTYESDNPSIVELLEHGVHFSHHLLNNFNIVKGQSFPVIIQGEEPLVHMLKWGIENPINIEVPDLTYVYSSTIAKQESLKNMIKYQRVLIPVQKFVHRQKGEGKDVLIRHPRNKVLWMAGLWAEGSDGRKGFVLITRDTEGAKRNLIRRIPIFITEKAYINAWVNRTLTTMDEINTIMTTQTQPQIELGSMEMIEI